eukprot:4348498-Lingulodinium_polyedra.AAC.1
MQQARRGPRGEAWPALPRLLVQPAEGPGPVQRPEERAASPTGKEAGGAAFCSAATVRWSGRAPWPPRTPGE